jgi:predicted neuraminidase
MIASLAASLITLCTLTADPLHTGDFIFPPNEFHNHGSGIVQTPDGGFLSVWFHGTGERQSDDVMLQGARKAPGADTWSEPFLMADTPNLPDCNPVLFVDPRETLWLIWITVQDNEWGGSLLKYRTSTDYQGDGPPVWDWQDVIHARPKNLEEQYLALMENNQDKLAALYKLMPGLEKQVAALKVATQTKIHRRLGWMTRISPIMTGEDRMMLGLYSDVFNCSLAAFTEDYGKTWTFSEPIMGTDPTLLGNIQPAFAQRSNGDIVAHMRDNGIPKYVRTCVSTDGGMTWGELDHLDIRDSGASVECTVLENGHWVLVNNSLASGRHILRAHLSTDEGKTWPHHRDLESEPVDKGSFSYPSLIQANDGTLHITYTHKKDGIQGSTIKHVQFNEAWILQGNPE